MPITASHRPARSGTQRARAAAARAPGASLSPCSCTRASLWPLATWPPISALQAPWTTSIESGVLPARSAQGPRASCPVHVRVCCRPRQAAGRRDPPIRGRPFRNRGSRNGTAARLATRCSTATLPAQVEEAVSFAVRLLRCLFGSDAIAEHKIEHGNPLVILGVAVSADSASFWARPSDDKREKWDRQICQALAANRLPSGAASKLAGSRRSRHIC